MAMMEDAAAVLEDFIQDVSNLPAEMAHLFEEIQAKDKQMQDCRNIIADRDNHLQKFIRQNGSLVINPKEDEYSNVITTNFDRAQALQEEKIALSDKASVLLDRQLRRLDIKIRELTRQGIMANDPPLPSILHPPSSSADGIFSDFSSPNNTGVSTPLTAMNNTNGGPAGVNIANSNLARLAHPNAASNRGGIIAAGAAAQLAMPSQAGRASAASYFASSAPATPAAAAGLQLHQRQQQRELSAGPADAKRRRLLGSLPATSSALARHSSLGPGTNGTPRAGTPSSVRSGSAGPNKRSSGGSVNGNSNKNPASSSAAQQQIRRKLARPGQLAGGRSRGSTPSSTAPRKQSSSTVNNRKNLINNHTSDLDKDRIVMVGGADGTHDNGLTHRKYEDDEEESGVNGGDQAKVEEDEDEEMMDPDSDDKRLYCTCRNVSYGNMVACDNDDCPYEWFHWSCVGVTKEPVGKWFCGECRVKLGITNASS